MISFGDYQHWLLEQVRGLNPTNSEWKYEPGDVVGFLYTPPKGTGAKANDMFVLMLVVGMRSNGIWGYNMFEMPQASNRNQIAKSIQDESIDNMEILRSLHTSANTRKGFKQYHVDNIKSRVMKFTDQQLKKVL